LECAKFSIDALPFLEHLQISVDVKLFVHENYLNFLKPIFSFICIFCRSLFVLLYFFLWSLCRLFFNLRILITIILLVHDRVTSTFLKPVFSRVHVTRSLVSYVCFVDRCLSFCTFFFGRVVCSSIYGFWLLLYYLCTTELPQLF
jgi:hypothetical protein